MCLSQNSRVCRFVISCAFRKSTKIALPQHQFTGGPAGRLRINRELKLRTRVASIFPNPASCLRLVSALLAECDEEWMTGKIYLPLKA